MDIQSASTAISAFKPGTANASSVESAAKAQTAPQAIEKAEKTAPDAPVDGGKVLDLKV
ncbi:MAG: hypothetical protein AAF607_01985 [Pseudomonadota bacterium]